VKVTSFFEKISRPALTDLHLSVGKEVQWSELYPPRLPDLFHGSQVVLAGRYRGAGDTTVTLTGRVDGSEREFTFPAHFHARSTDKPFVEDIWARRKVGYLLEQIRLGGEKKELVDAVVTLAKRYGIATPYTSYLVVPDTPIPIVRPPRPFPPPWPRPLDPYILQPATPGGAPRKVAEVAREVQQTAGDLARNRSRFEDDRLARLPADAKGDATILALAAARDQKQASEAAHKALGAGQIRQVQIDKLGVAFSAQMNNLKNQAQVQASAVRQAAGRNLVEIGGLWVDEGFDARTPVVVVKAQSDAYFRILERQPQAREVFKLGNHLVWVTPSGTALAIDANDGQEQLADAAIDKLFAP
jgi:Ca-activated chloride channel family protein